jgi:hypothetical protein
LNEWSSRASYLKREQIVICSNKGGTAEEKLSSLIGMKGFYFFVKLFIRPVDLKKII